MDQSITQFTLTIHLSELIQSNLLSKDTKLRILDKITKERMLSEMMKLNYDYDIMTDIHQKVTLEHKYLINSFLGRFPESGIAEVITT